MPQPRRFSPMWLALVALAGACLPQIALAQNLAQWTQPASGAWTDSANWTIVNPALGYPDNYRWQGSETYVVEIDAAGSPYDVTLAMGDDIWVNDLTIDSPDAKLLLDGGYLQTRELRVEQGHLELDSGRLIGARVSTGPGGSVSTGFGPLTLDNVTLATDLTAKHQIYTYEPLTLEAGATLYASAGRLGSRGDIVGQGEWVLDSAGSCDGDSLRTCELEYYAQHGPIVIGPDVTVRSAGRRLFMSESSGSTLPQGVLENQGTMLFESPGGFTYIERLRNRGLIRVAGGDHLQAGFVGDVGDVVIGPGGHFEVFREPNFNRPVVVEQGTLELLTSTIAGYTAPVDLRDGGRVLLSVPQLGIPIASTGGEVRLNTSFTANELQALSISGPAQVVATSYSFGSGFFVDLEGGALDISELPYDLQFGRVRVSNGVLTGGLDTLPILQGYYSPSYSLELRDLTLDLPLVIDVLNVEVEGVSTLARPVIVNDRELRLYEDWNNAGGITVHGGVLLLGSPGAAFGQIAMTGGELQIGYEQTLDQLAALLVGSPEHMVLVTRLDLTEGGAVPDGRTLELEQFPHSLGVRGSSGRIEGGTIVGTAGGRALAMYGGSVTNATVQGATIEGQGSLTDVTATGAKLTGTFSGTRLALADSSVDGTLTGSADGIVFQGAFNLNGQLTGSFGRGTHTGGNFRFAAGSEITGRGLIGNSSGRIQQTTVVIEDASFTIPQGIDLVSATQYDSTDLVDAPATDLTVEGDILAGYTSVWGVGPSDSWTFRVASLETRGRVDVTADGRMAVEGGAWRHAGSGAVAGGRVEAPEATILPAGSLDAWGTIAVGEGGLAVDGLLTAGADAEKLLVEGDLTMGPIGVLALTLRDPDGVLPTDVPDESLVVTGQATLDGALQIETPQDFFLDPPEVGSQYTVIVAGQIVDGFATLLHNPRVGFAATYYADSVVLTLTAVDVLAGDYNADGSVDAADYTLWRDHSGDPSLYAAWRDNYGGTDGSVNGRVSVPEPAAWMLALLALGPARRTHPLACDA